MPTRHAKCSASSSHRWSNCTAAPTYEAQFPAEASSVYAMEGTLAHEFAELAVRLKFGLITKRTYGSRVKKLQARELYQDEMLKTAEFYADYIYRKSMTFESKPHVATEIRVDFSEYVPEGFGTCDCVMIGGDTLCITDYKHGKGVPVSAEVNSQMMLYALGALNQYSMIYGDSIRKVSMAIVQPRITEEVSEYETTVEELRMWGKVLKPIALEAYNGPGKFAPGEWCRFCNGKSVCKARADHYMALEAYNDAVALGSLTPQERFEIDKATMLGQPHRTTLTDEEVGDLLIRAEKLTAWVEDLKEYALSAALEGKEVTGWKVVEGRRNRTFTNLDGALDHMKSLGYDEALLYERKPKTLTGLEALMGKIAFAEHMKEYITRPAGKPTLAKASDKRPVYNPMAADAAGLK